jgi:hypothetical protein
LESRASLDVPGKCFLPLGAVNPPQQFVGGLIDLVAGVGTVDGTLRVVWIEHDNAGLDKLVQ